MPEEIGRQPTFFAALIAGGCAGTSVVLPLFPIDTMKTRLQSAKGFMKAGGFRHIYRGLSVAAAGSAPSTAAFFSTYETTKPRLRRLGLGDDSPVLQGLAASCGEMAACLMSTPTEVMKPRMQVGRYATLPEAFRSILRAEGVAGFYTGYFATVAREVFFSFIQFPIWERLKSEVGARQGAPASPWQAALCGSFAGGFSAAVTTPLDVVKTRRMLGESKVGLWRTLYDIATKEGIQACFGGIVPRTMWISMSGFVFFGAYETALKTICMVLPE
eukprot:NODE_13500_length_1161_cov_11.152805.p1 GENE.NODE_13500_length_1161_cov_11.152805~~NODE_13500_length_1161_cov_11.152805.p1  ORF type:complete len:273 (-),score=62.71 NODE_13500_length_1161_cov_11.152805:237-1055(-)